MSRHRSRGVKAINAIRRHRRRLAKKGLQPSIRTAAVVAIRETQPNTWTGLAAQTAAIATMDTTAATWRNRVALAPIAATAMVPAAAAIAPGPAAFGIAVTGLAGLVAGQKEHQSRRRRRGLAGWAAGALVWMGAEAVGATGGMVWWQDMAVLATAVAPGAVAWWRRPEPDSGMVLEPSEPSRELTWIPPAVLLLGQVLENSCRIPRSPIEGGRVERVSSPADGVAVAVVAMPDGMHADQLDTRKLRTGLEAMLDRAGAGELGHLRRGSVQIQPADEALGVTRVQITASWSRALDSGLLPWKPPENLVPGQAWLGVDDARDDLVVPMWETGEDGKVSAIHAWLIGATGGGKSTTLRTLLAPGVISGVQLLILLDGKGDSLDELAPYAIGRAVARSSTSWRQGIALAYAIMVARQKRLGTPQRWTGPTVEDPLITIVIDECTSVLAGLTGREVRMMQEIARMGRSVGVNSIQSGQIPLIETLIGESGWRSQARLVLGHGVLDAIHNRIATQSGGNDGPSLLGLPIGRVVALLGGKVLAYRGRVALLSEGQLAKMTAESPRAVLNELDRSAHVCRLMDLAEGWSDSEPEAVVDLDSLLGEWATDEDEGGDERAGGGGRARAPAPVTTSAPARGGALVQVSPQSRPAAAGGRGEGGLRKLVLNWVMTRAGTTRGEVVAHFKENGGYSRSAVYKEINGLIEGKRIVERDGGLVATLRIHVAQRATAEGGGV